MNVVTRIVDSFLAGTFTDRLFKAVLEGVGEKQSDLIYYRSTIAEQR
jgi:hypothetical protein